MVFKLTNHSKDNCNLEVSSSIPLGITWAQIRWALEMLINVCVMNPLTSPVGGRAYYRGQTIANRDLGSRDSNSGKSCIICRPRNYYSLTCLSTDLASLRNPKRLFINKRSADLLSLQLSRVEFPSPASECDAVSAGAFRATMMGIIMIGLHIINHH